MNKLKHIFLFVFFLHAGLLSAQDSLVRRSDTLLFRGIFSAWLNLNYQKQLGLWPGARYIPQVNYRLQTARGPLIDFEGSVNLSAQAGIISADSVVTDAAISPYRLWARYSTRQFEARIGLQKINFGSATMLRPLMWFDQIDPRDPLQLTNGVYGLLGRYYFLNNRNIWLWALYGNKNPKNWEIGNTSQRSPEFGGRFQSPVKKGEAGLSYHFRMAENRMNGSTLQLIPENRIGLDAKWDIGPGLWFESTLINKGADMGVFTNQLLVTLGTDYTFALGDGLNLMFEQFLLSYDRQPFEFENRFTLTALSLSYPLSMFDNVSALVYYDWINNKTYNFMNWKHQFKKLYVYLMAYWNPQNSLLPQQQGTFNLFGGRGVLIMLVYNH